MDVTVLEGRGVGAPRVCCVYTYILSVRAVMLIVLVHTPSHAMPYCPSQRYAKKHNKQAGDS